MAEENEEKKGVTDYVVNAVVGINNNMMDSWDYTFKKLGVFDDYAPQVNAEDYSAEEDLKTIEAAEKQMDLQPIPKNGFHTSTSDDIVTANAVLRCTWGATFGQLMVIPVNRCSIGKTLGNVATIKDCLPVVNIPSFGVCFNLLNPAVALATAAATAAHGGKFTLVPMPCGATMAPTPWIPLTKNLLGKTPVLTKNSTCFCWGIGTIDIKHCGQGLAPNTYNGFMGPDWITTLQGNAQLVANVLGAIGPLAGLGKKGIVRLAGLAQKAALTSRFAKLGQIGLKIEQITTNLSKAGTVEKVGKVGNVVTGTGEALANTVDATISISQGQYGEGISSGADAVIGALGTAAGTGKFKGLNKSLMKTASNIDVSNARKNLDNIPSDVDVANAHLNARAAQVDVDAAKINKVEADMNLDAATDGQKAAQANLDKAKGAKKEAQTDLDNANKAKADADAKASSAEKGKAKADAEYESASQKKGEADAEYGNAKEAQFDANARASEASAEKISADTNYNNAKKAQADADANLNNTKKGNADGDFDYESAKIEKTNADMNASMASADKASADAEFANAGKAKADADARVSNAEKGKAKADAEYDAASSKKQEADLEYNSAKVDQAKADMDVSSATADKAIADSNYVDARNAKKEADLQVSNAKAEKERAEQELAKAQEAKAEADKAAAKADKAKANEEKARKNVEKTEKVAEEMSDRTFADEMWYKDHVLETGENAINDYVKDQKKKKEEEKKVEDALSKYTNYGIC